MRYLSHLGLGFFLVAVWAGWFGLTLNLLGFAVHMPVRMLVTGALSILVPCISPSVSAGEASRYAISFGGEAARRVPCAAMSDGEGLRRSPRLDKVIHERARLIILAYLSSSSRASVELSRAAGEAGASAGALRTLAGAGYVKIAKEASRREQAQDGRQTDGRIGLVADKALCNLHVPCSRKRPKLDGKVPGRELQLLPQLGKAHRRPAAGGQVGKDNEASPLVDHLVQARAALRSLPVTHRRATRRAA